MPFAGFKDFDACVRANRTKRNPQAFCAALERRVKGLSGSVVKVDRRGLVFGWASVSIDGTQQEVVDSQGDIIEPEMLEDAVVDFMLHHRQAGEMHKGHAVGQIVYSLVTTPEILKSMGPPFDGLQDAPVGAFVGVKLDPTSETFRKVEAGEFKMFSIQGFGVREDANEA